jgi:hypothetical protein
MAFNNYKIIGEVLKEFQVFYTEANFIVESAFNVSNYFREDLELVMREGVVDNSESAICENLIYPVIKEVWKQYLKNFIQELDKLFAAVNYVFQQCELQLNNLVAV